VTQKVGHSLFIEPEFLNRSTKLLTINWFLNPPVAPLPFPLFLVSPLRILPRLPNWNAVTCTTTTVSSMRVTKEACQKDLRLIYAAAPFTLNFQFSIWSKLMPKQFFSKQNYPKCCFILRNMKGMYLVCDFMLSKIVTLSVEN
jgi:hypothetical protein